MLCSAPLPIVNEQHSNCHLETSTMNQQELCECLEALRALESAVRKHHERIHPKADN